MDIDRPRQNHDTSQGRIKFLLPKLKAVMLRPEFRIVFLCLAWFVLSRAKTGQQFFSPFLIFCVAQLQFRLSSSALWTRVPSWVRNIGVLWYVFWIAVSLFAGLYGGLIIELYPDDNPVVMASAECILLRQLIQYLFGVDYFPLMYIWLGTLFVALFDWSFMLSPEEECVASEIKKNRVRNKKKTEKIN